MRPRTLRLDSAERQEQAAFEIFTLRWLRYILVYHEPRVSYTLVYHGREVRRRNMGQELEPGMLVRHPARPDWGLGQIQSVVGNRITVNFEHAGKLLINGERVTLDVVSDDAA